MGDVVYRVPGYCSGRSLQLLEGLAAAGWPDHIVTQLKGDLPLFESAAIRADFDEALHVFSADPHASLIPSLERIYQYIRAITKAERNEELQRKASSKDKDSIAANTLLSKLGGGSDAEEESILGPVANISFEVKSPKAKNTVTRGQTGT